MIRDHTGTTREPQGKTNKKKAAFTDSLTGEKWDSNPRPSEPQSDALTNWAILTIFILSSVYLFKTVQR